MPFAIKVLPPGSQCRCLLPVFSDGLKGGRILLKEEYCLLPIGHSGPHRGPSGGALENVADFPRMMDPARKR